MYSSYKDNIWGVDSADMQLICKYKELIKYLLCVIDLFSKYAWVVPLKNKKGESIVDAFQKALNTLKKPNKIWVDHVSEFYKNVFKKWLKGKSVVVERFIRTLKKKFISI